MEIADVAFMLAWLFQPIAWFLTLKAINLSLLRPTLPSFVIAYILIIQYIGLPILYFKLDDYRSEYVVDNGLVIMLWIITSATIYLMIFGYVIAWMLIGRLKGFTSKSTQMTPLNKSQKFKLKLISVFCVYVLLVYISKVDLRNIALIVSMGFGNDIGIDRARSLMGNDFGGGYHWYQMFMQDVLLFTFMCFMADYILVRNRMKLMLMALIFIPLSFAFIMATEKGPFINFIIAIFLLLTWAKNKGKIALKNLIKFGAVIFFIGINFYIYFMGSEDMYSAVFSMFSRILTGQIQPAYHYLEIFPEKQSFIDGRSFPNPLLIFPFEPYNLTVEVERIINSGSLASDVVGSAPTIFWGELYANFGIIGPIIFAPFVGFGLYILNSFIFKMDLTAITLSFYMWTLVHFKDLAATSLSNFVVDLRFIFIIILILIVNNKLFKINRVNHV